LSIVIREKHTFDEANSMEGMGALGGVAGREATRDSFSFGGGVVGDAGDAVVPGVWLEGTAGGEAAGEVGVGV
jgi:hypothetical protein